jgi:hypothetical protein
LSTVRTGSPRLRAIALAALIVTLGTHASLAVEASYIRLFEGNWAGTGVVVNDAKPWPVECSALGRPAANSLAIRANCHVMLVVSVSIDVDVDYDAKSDSYTGTYRAGHLTAAISGKRSGDTVNFTMTWDTPIDPAGDRGGRLTIVNQGKGDFRLLIDNVKANGPAERTTDVRLSLH